METAERAEVHSTKQGKKKHPKRDVYMETTEKIVELLEASRIPWQKGWDGKIGAQSDGTLAVHPGAFKATDDAKEGIELKIQKDYARNFRENTFKEGLSIYTPTDEKGWQKLDEDFAARFLIDTLRNGKYDDGRVDADLLKENIYDFVGKAIQENSPYSVISQDAGYGYDRAVAAFSRKEVNEAFETHQKKSAGNFAEQEKIASQSAAPEEREEDAGCGR